MIDIEKIRELCALAVEGSFAAEEGRVLLARIAELEEDAQILDWMDEQWPNIECSYGHCDIFRLEPTQGEERVFSDSNIREAARKAMAAPSFTGETIPQRRTRIAELEELVRSHESTICTLSAQRDYAVRKRNARIAKLEAALKSIMSTYENREMSNELVLTTIARIAHEALEGK